MTLRASRLDPSLPAGPGLPCFAARIAQDLGVGFNTPAIIRFPLEMTHFQQPKDRLNRHQPQAAEANASRTTAFTEEISEVLTALSGGRHA